MANPLSPTPGDNQAETDSDHRTKQHEPPWHTKRIRLVQQMQQTKLPRYYATPPRKQGLAANDANQIV